MQIRVHSSKIPVIRIALYLIGIVTIAFVLAHLVGQEMTRDGQKSSRKERPAKLKPSVPGNMQGEVLP